MTIIEWLTTTLGIPVSNQNIFIWYIVGAVVLLILLDGVITFLLTGISSLTMRGKK